MSKSTTAISKDVEKTEEVKNLIEKTEQHHSATTYIETMTHLFKGNIGPGLFAMGYGFKNGGLITGPLLTIAIAVISIHCQHILIQCSKKIYEDGHIDCLPDYAETVEKSFAIGPMNLRRFSNRMKTITNIFICVTQLGFCCVYLVFISINFKQLMDFHGLVLDVHLVMFLIFLPILLPCLIRNLKYLAPVSQVANFCIISGLVITFYFAIEGGLPSITERKYVTNGHQMALYFGTTIFAFEGIALVLPLKRAMKKPNSFEKTFGVLNVGMVAVTFLFVSAGFLGYLKWGEDVKGSLTLNLDVKNPLAQYVKMAVSMGVLLGYPLQFFIVIQIMWPSVQQKCGCVKHPVAGELFFRFVLVLITFGIAELVPQLGLFISLIGALCSTTLALVLPPIIELIVKSGNKEGPGMSLFIKNTFILILALLGFTTGSYESISEIVKAFGKPEA